MPWGAIIGAVASVAGSVISSSASKSGIPKTQKVDLQGVDLSSPNAALGQYSDQIQAYPELEGVVNQLNTSATQDYTKLLNSLYPGVSNQLSQISSIANSYLQGQIPSDVQAQIQRATAQQAMTGGYSGTGMSANLTSRDLGLTSMNLQQQGVNMASTGLNMAKSMVPGYINPASLLFSPVQLMNRSDQANYYNTDVTNQTKLINAGYAQQAAAQAQARQQQNANNLGSTISNLFGKTGSGSVSNTLGSWVSSLSGSMSGGGNFNPNFNQAQADQWAQAAGYTDYNAMQNAGMV